MKNFIRFLAFLLVLLSIYAAFETEILFAIEEVYCFCNETDFNQADGHSVWNDLKDGEYWDGKTFLLNKYVKSLGFVPALFPQEGRAAIWRCGQRRFSIDDENNSMIGIVGDEWDDLTTKSEYVSDGYSIKYNDKIIENLSEETMIYFISSLINLRKSNNLRDTTDGVRADIDYYHTNGKAL